MYDLLRACRERFGGESAVETRPRDIPASQLTVSGNSRGKEKQYFNLKNSGRITP